MLNCIVDFRGGGNWNDYSLMLMITELKDWIMVPFGLNQPFCVLHHSRRTIQFSGLVNHADHIKRKPSTVSQTIENRKAQKKCSAPNGVLLVGLTLSRITYFSIVIQYTIVFLWSAYNPLRLCSCRLSISPSVLEISSWSAEEEVAFSSWKPASARDIRDVSGHCD